MPTYEYECTKCGYTFEVFQKVNDKPRKRCPKCHSKVRRVISGGAGVIFKGSGFYATDYKKKPSSVNESKDESSNKGNEAKNKDFKEPAGKKT